MEESNTPTPSRTPVNSGPMYPPPLGVPQRKSRKGLWITLIVIVVIALAAAGYMWWQNQPAPEPIAPVETGEEQPTEEDLRAARVQDASVEFVNLTLPFDTEDLSQTAGDVYPFGVVRDEQDNPVIGNTGITLPLEESSSVYAVSTGTIVAVTPSQDGEGSDITQVAAKATEGEGWVFTYENVVPSTEVTVGSDVARGSALGTALDPSTTPTRFSAQYAVNNYQEPTDYACWTGVLDPQEQLELLVWWDEYRTSSYLESSWQTAEVGTSFPLRGLLDEDAFPSGPQLCYPLGTDVR